MQEEGAGCHTASPPSQGLSLTLSSASRRLEQGGDPARSPHPCAAPGSRRPGLRAAPRAPWRRSRARLEGARASMTEVEPVLDFASSGRTGRRNALPDILGSPAGVSPSDLPLKLAEMSLSAGGCRQGWGRRGGGRSGAAHCPPSIHRRQLPGDAVTFHGGAPTAAPKPRAEGHILTPLGAAFLTARRREAVEHQPSFPGTAGAWWPSLGTMRPPHRPSPAGEEPRGDLWGPREASHPRRARTGTFALQEDSFLPWHAEGLHWGGFSPPLGSSRARGATPGA
uniref:cAMP-dependent protein kinase inhibitor beta n=1 Tax=Anas platyrhynchos platyrhynchos TaxID=8840 RepID=A0A493SVM8_ANAPP